MPESSIAIAMCAYNSARFLREQLDSFVAQTRQPDELVICDDASTDDTAAIVAEFARAAPFAVRVQPQPKNVGRIANFETAISLCTKDIIFLSDADDVWHPEKLARMAQALDAAPGASGVFCDAEVVDAALQPLGYSHFEHCGFGPLLRSQQLSGAAIEPLLRSQLVQGSALAFRAEYRPFILPLSPYWGHDSWIAVLLAAHGDLIAVNDKLMSYRQHGGNLVGATPRRATPLARWTSKVRTPRQHYHKAHDTVTYFLKQVSDLADRLDNQAVLARTSELLTAIEQRYQRLNKRRRHVEAVLALLGDRPRGATARIA